VAVVVVAVSLLFWANLLDAARAFEDASTRNRALPPEEAAVAGGVAVGAKVAFIDWARSQIAERDSYYLMPDEARAKRSVYQWLSYRMLPRLSAESPEEADWLIFYRAEPRGTNGRADFVPPVHYARGFAIARRR
jgi:Tfp pilus assembly protein PilV